EAMRQGNSVFVDDRFNTIPDQCAYLSTLPKASAERIAELAEQFGKDPIGLPKASSTMLSVTQAQGTISEMRSSEASPKETVPGETLPKEMPASVHVTLANGVRIDCRELPPQVVNRLSRLAAFRNPQYGKKLRMHFSVRDIPRFIDQSRFEDNELVLPRACLDEALSVVRAAGATPLVNDARSNGKRIHARFTGVLRASQEPCRDKLVGHELGVLVAPTAFGKTVVAASIIATHQVSTLIIVPNTPLLSQWRESLNRFLEIDDEPPVLLTPTGRKRKHQPGVVGIMGGGKHLRSEIVDIALPDSLMEKGEVVGDKVVSPFVSEYGMVIVDEAHRVAAPTLLEVLSAVRAHYVYAMTATPKRTDGLDRILFLECGPLRHEVTTAEQIDEQDMRRLLVTRFSMSKPNLEERTDWHALMDYISEDEERNHLVVSDAVRALRFGRTPLVLTRRVEHARVLARQIEESARSLEVRVLLLVGADPDVIRRKNLEELRLVPKQSPLCLVATGNYVGEGFDFDRLDTLLLAGPVADETPLTQWVGRLHRVYADKQEVIVMDYIDPAIPMFDREWRKRLRKYRDLGYQTATEDDLSLVGLQDSTTPVGHLFSGKEYLNGLAADLADCSNHAVIASSWARYERIKMLRPVLEELRGRGAKVEVVLSEPSKGLSEWQQIRATLQDLGCNVRVASSGGFPDCVVLDDAVLWYGEIAPLAYPKKDECLLNDRLLAP
ncbi:MAG: DEAD/DEAH box helicase family protein, partial [Coriobacteriales bacterium]|nr:DEAD/DEAH box helicase family protein [Coriobacteriales bacterium]